MLSGSLHNLIQSLSFFLQLNSEFYSSRRRKRRFDGEDSLVKDGSVAGGDHLVDEVAGVKHRDAHQPLDDELRLEKVLTFLGQPLRRDRQHVSDTLAPGSDPAEP